MSSEWLSDRKTYRGMGSYRFTREQIESYALILDIKILSYVRTIYASLKSNPRNGYWGQAVIFEGSIPRERRSLEFPRERVLNVRNNQALDEVIAEFQEREQAGLREYLENALEAAFPGLFERDPIPLLPHRETIVKFKALPFSQFEFNCYWMPLSTTESLLPDFNQQDPNPDGDEYEEPMQNPIGDPYAGNESPSFVDERNDPRDYATEENEPYPRPIYFGVRRDASTGAGFPNGCTADAVANFNHLWENAGPPPYTFEFGFLSGSPCAGAGQGYRIRASDGTFSETYSATATVLGGEIIVFSEEPF